MVEGGIAIRDYILREFLVGENPERLTDTTPLISGGILDSIAIIKLIAFLEETFPLTIEDTDMVPENFQTLNDVERFIAGKLGTGNGAAEQPAQVAAVAAS